MTNDQARVAEIRRLNDRFRRTLVGGKLNATASVHALPFQEMRKLFTEIRTYSDFTEDNDPYGEHDFGAVEQNGVKYFWKIDYYDLAMKNLSREPANPMVTNRVLTIMRADEY